ncbi:LysM peptidoglycan-binding domain-containing protein [Motiliproteus coralliicola]|uniref:LysM peptidoglycan-binding domain-containing protein n=1 Tax=Motiliproteus coralliicola TaxID=2283196 RepID=A0A369WUM8_9GAMM|nr:FecR domain-containing protein [Motiliproteus coralliicola]RDE24833.1 LysM peptidoglycan-binding domain-containing protein [Motiliproteus coralliicola]
MNANRFAGWALCLLLMGMTQSLQAQDWVYTTVEGDNLWNLSEQHLDSVMRFKQLQRINGIQNPKQMRPGTRLRIPLKWIRSNPVPAAVEAIRGDVELRRADGSKAPLGPDSLIYLGDQVRTSRGSSVAIRFADDSILTLHEDSLIRFDHLSAHGRTGMVDSRLNLLEGRIDTRVIPAKGPGSRFQIQTPSAISAVRGTEYRAAVSDNGQVSSIEVLEGSVAVKGADQQSLIKAGFGTRVAEGKAPLPPRKLLPAPALKPVEGAIRSINWVLQWQSVEGAHAYRLEIAEQRSFDTLLWQQLSVHHRAALPDLPDGRYFARIRAVDSLGLEGHNAVQELLLDARPQAPIQLKPDDQQLYRGESPTLRWTASQEADHYRLEIAADAQFEQLLVNQDQLAATRFDTAELPIPGTYFWRLTSIAADGEQGPVGTVRSWQVKAIPAAVDTQMQSTDDGKLVASWPAGLEGQRYQLQMAQDPQFNQLIVDQLLESPSYRFEPFSGGSRYLRVRAVEPDGFAGPWGAVQRVLPTPNWTPMILFNAALGLLLLL